MTKLQRLNQPENYKLSEQDFEKEESFDSLLNHLTNVVESEPLHKISINKIGVFNQKEMIYIEDIEAPETYIPIPCEISVGVDLSENRGIHMSRCIQSIFALSKRKFKTLDDFAYELATTVRNEQKTETSFANVTGTYFHKRITKKTKLETHDSMEFISQVTVSDKETQIKTGLKVYHLTGCPCTKTYTKYSIVPELKKQGFTLPQIHNILEVAIAGTHMQLGTTILTINKTKKDTVTHKDLYEVLDKSLHLVNELLKRPDEHDLVVRALKRPQFTEDAAREVAFNTYQEFKNILPSNTEISIDQILKDSIHIHDVGALVKKTLGEIGKELGE